ncbi:hypothetical protein [Halotia branconii]|uniref:Uncharacterized protein n=1 Tax=Halotia branconii CENA392 TaxID=1539056 RepID=A0AAJ6NWN3_9CYAN|nr:hypothetical protein [Halotia branconii]WGV28108.1 hypothetical protein QI031_11805 [Halotia branconii CENA392]
MNRTICIGLMVLPVYLYAAEASFASSGSIPILKDQISIINVLTVHSKNTQLHLAPWQIFARDEQTGECLRSGDCKD